MLGDVVRWAPLTGFLEDAGLDCSSVLELRHGRDGWNGAWDAPHLGLGPVYGARPGRAEITLLGDPARPALREGAVRAVAWTDAGADLAEGELEAILTAAMRVAAELVVVAAPAGLAGRIEWHARSDGRFETRRLPWGSAAVECAAAQADRLPEVRPEVSRALRSQRGAWARLARSTASPDSGRTLVVLTRLEPRVPVLDSLSGLPGSGPAAVAEALAPALLCPACAAAAVCATGRECRPLECTACGAGAAAGLRGFPDLRPSAWRCDPATKRPDATVVIPAYGKSEWTRQCLASLFSVPAGASFEVVVVDNASVEDPREALAEFLPRIRLIRNPVNVGFARACNQGARAAAGCHVLLLNNDTEAHPGWLGPLVEALDQDPTVGIAGSKLLFPDGTIQHAGVTVAGNPDFPQGVTGFHIYQHDPAGAPHVDRPRDFQVVTAACCLVRGELFDALGGFDPAYWNGFEDVDLCFRARAHGFRVVYRPRSVLTHHESMGGPERFSRMSHNAKVLNARWAGRVRPDVHPVHLEDGFLTCWRRRGGGPRTEVLPVGLTSVVLLPGHGVRQAAECAEAVRRHTTLSHEILVAWDPGCGAFPAELARLGARAVGTGSAPGLSRAANASVRAAKGRFVVLLDDRARVTAGWLEGLLGALADRDAAGMAGPLLPVPSGAQAVGEALCSAGPAEAAAQLRALRRMDYADTPGLRPECLALRCEVVERIGELDEALDGQAAVDDFCLRARESGLGLTVARDTYVHVDGGDPEEGAPSAARAFALKWGVTAAEYFLLGHPPVRAVPDLPEAGDPAVRALLRAASEELDAGLVREAVARLEAAHATGDGPAELALLLGIARCACGDFEAGAREFAEAVRRAPRSRRALGHLAHVLRHLGRGEEAAGAFSRLLELDPQDPEALLDTGDCLLSIGRTDMAVQCFHLARKLAPRNEDIHDRLRLLGAAGEEELPLAG
ncbi:MAG: glycosyltransferase [Candidatus Eisenbacteria bacterium]|nr:glycosyltransferase [Candidatus Eisenbacteria bacterium]